MTITNIVSGFCTTGIYPFNPDIILTKLSRSQQQLGASSSGVTEEIVFSPDLIIYKYKEWFNNGYNIYIDEKYVQWLRIFHPDHLPPG